GLERVGLFAPVVQAVGVHGRPSRQKPASQAAVEMHRLDSIHDASPLARTPPRSVHRRPALLTRRMPSEELRNTVEAIRTALRSPLAFRRPSDRTTLTPASFAVRLSIAFPLHQEVPGVGLLPATPTPLD